MIRLLTTLSNPFTELLRSSHTFPAFSGSCIETTVPPSLYHTPQTSWRQSTHHTSNFFSRTSFKHRHIRACSTKVDTTLTHIDLDGRPTMVDVGDKEITHRVATASGRILLNEIGFSLLSENELNKGSNPTDTSSPSTFQARSISADAEFEMRKRKARSKGNVLVTAQLAAIMATKQTSALIPLCHPLPVTHVQVVFTLEPESLSVLCTATVRCDGKTGVEMEALTAVSVGLLTVWDMLKAIGGKEMIVRLFSYDLSWRIMNSAPDA